MSKTIYIGGRLESKEKGNVVTGANAILDDTKGKKQNVINKETDDELARLEQSKQDNLNFDNAPTEDSTNPVTSGGVYTAEKALSDAIEAILLLIPSAATALNKLVDTNTMNSSISTATATFRGTYNAVSDLGLTYQATHAQIEAALDALGLTADNNDFAFVQIPVSDQSQDIAKTERFKFNGTNWLYEYDLNTSGFTAAQWAAINSGITVALVTKLTDLPTAAALQLALNAKQDTLTFDNEPTALSQNPVTSGGIYTAIQAVATALSDYSTTTDGRLNVLEGLVPTEASSSNKLTDKAYVDGLIQAITELIPAEATTTNQLADKAYVLAQILAATPAFKGQFVTLAELQAVASPKAGDLGIVRTKDSDGMDVFTVYQYLNNAWNVFYSLSYHPQTKPATTGTTGDYPYNGMGRVELAKNIVNGVNQLTQDMFYKGAVGSRVPNTNTIFVIRYDYVLGENITIPDNCVLEFDGGSISGAYTLIFTNTLLKGEKNISTSIDGVILNSEIYSSDFGVDASMVDASARLTALSVFCLRNNIELIVDTPVNLTGEWLVYDSSADAGTAQSFVHGPKISAIDNTIAVNLNSSSAKITIQASAVGSTVNHRFYRGGWFRNFVINANASGINHCLFLQGWWNADITGIFIDGLNKASYGIKIAELVDNPDWTSSVLMFNNVRIYRCTSVGFYNPSYYTLSTTIFNGCIFEQNDTGLRISGAGIRFINGSLSYNRIGVAIGSGTNSGRARQINFDNVEIDGTGVGEYGALFVGGSEKIYFKECRFFNESATSNYFGVATKDSNIPCPYNTFESCVFGSVGTNEYVVKNKDIDNDAFSWNFTDNLFIDAQLRGTTSWCDGNNFFSNNTSGKVANRRINTFQTETLSDDTIEITSFDGNPVPYSKVDTILQSAKRIKVKAVVDLKDIAGHNFANNAEIILDGGCFTNSGNTGTWIGLRSNVSVSDYDKLIDPNTVSAIAIYDVKEGTQRWDSTNHKPLWWNGTAWVDATGATV